MNTNLEQYVGKMVNVRGLDGDSVITGTLVGLYDYGVILNGSSAGATTNAGASFGTRFFPWAAIQYIDLGASAAGQARVA